jgi:hypothetical protein
MDTMNALFSGIGNKAIENGSDSEGEKKKKKKKDKKKSKEEKKEDVSQDTTKQSETSIMNLLDFDDHPTSVSISSDRGP